MCRKLSHLFFLLTSTAILALGQGSESSSPPFRIGNLPPGVSIHRLDNGLRVLLIENPTLPMTGINVVIKVGSAYETFATSGMSHMLEHLLFNGTQTRTQEELYAQVDRLGAYNNANTSTYYTNFMMVAPNGKIIQAMEIQADMLFRSILPEEKFQKEKGIVLEEIAKSLANPKEQVERDCLDFLFPQHALSLPTLGTYATIEAMSRDDVFSFYRNHYVPNNMIMSVVGQFDSKTMLESVKKIYGSAPPANVLRPQDDSWHVGYDHPAWSTSEKIRVGQRFHDGESSVIQLFFELHESMPPAFYDLLEQRIDQEIPDLQKSLETQFPDKIHSIMFLPRSTPVRSFLEFSITLKKTGQIQKIANKFLHLIQAKKFSPADATVTAMATRTRTDFLKNIEKPHMFGIYNAEEFAVSGIESVLDSYDSVIFQQSAEALNSLDLSDCNVHILVHHSTQKPEEESQPSETKDAFFDDLDSGLRLIVTQNPGSDLLAIHYLVTHKAYFESKFGRDAAKILHDCLSQRLQSEENQRLSERFGFTYTLNDNPFIPMDNIYLHPDFAYLRIEGLADDLPAAIGFLNDQIRDFIPTRSEFERAVKKFKSLDNPMRRRMGRSDFDNAYKDLIFEKPKYERSKEQITFDRLQPFTEVFFHPANMIVAVTAPETPETIRDLFLPWAQSAQNLSTPLPEASDKTFKLREDAAEIEKEIGGKQSHLFFGFTKSIDPKDRSALQALGLILSDRIVFDIREKQGMAYRMSAGIEIRRDRAMFFIKMGTRTINVDKLVPQFPDFFQSQKLKDLTQDELEKAINQYLGRMMFRRLSSINQAYYRSHDLYFHKDTDYSQKLFEKLAAVTLDDVTRVAEKYLHVHNAVTVVMR